VPLAVRAGKDQPLVGIEFLSERAVDRVISQAAGFAQVRNRLVTAFDAASW
jgi:hypothetical protein